MSTGTGDDIEDEPGFAHDGLDFDNYGRYRPNYPPSMVKLIMDYHRAHSNSLRLAHDIGCGTGVFGPRLAEYFQHVHSSDANKSNVSKARENISKWYASNWWKARFSFSVTAAEKADEPFVKGGIDMVTMMESAQWTDIDTTMRSIAESLAPNGTLAIVSYRPALVVVDNPQVREAVDALFHALFHAWGSKVMGLNSETAFVPVTEQKAMPQSSNPLEYVPLPDKLFIQDVTKRIRINFHGQGDQAMTIPGQENVVAASLPVDPRHRRYEFNCGTGTQPGDQEAEGWQQIVDASWFHGLVCSMGFENRLHLFGNQLQAIEQKMAETTSSGSVAIEWVVAVLLATRK